MLYRFMEIELHTWDDVDEDELLGNLKDMLIAKNDDEIVRLRIYRETEYKRGDTNSL